MKQARAAVFIPHKGCPHDCVFCNQKSITGAAQEVTCEEAKEMIKAQLATMGPKVAAEIAFFGGSFTAVEPGYQTALLQAAYPFVQAGRVKGIRISTRPDAIDGAILQNLKHYGVTTIELGAQSMDDGVLRLAGRGHDAEAVRCAARQIKDAGFSLGLQMMCGLMGDSFEKSSRTADEFIALGADCVRIYPTLVLTGTALCRQYEAGAYRPLSLDEAVSWCADFWLRFRAAGIPVIRLGLNPGKSLEEGLVAGPYHPAFGEMVKSEACFLAAKVFRDETGAEELTVLAGPRHMSVLMGQKRKNWEKICALFGGRAKVVQNQDTDGIVFIGENGKRRMF